MSLGGWLRALVRPSAEPAPRADWSRVREVFTAALEAEPSGRAAFVDRACAGDATLRAEVLHLLAAHDRGSIIDRPLDAIVSPLLAPDEMPTIEAAQPAVVSHYERLERIAGGGMGVLYRARDLQLQRIVALKFLPTGLGSDPRAKSRFLLEARAAAALDHRNVCTIHDIGESDDGQLFIAMPFYSGETVADLVARGPLPISRALSIAIQVARGLAHAHERGSIHRDIKPANIMVTADEVVKILDFGIVKQDGIGLTRTGTAVGTLPYMSPECLHRDAVDARTDLWSLGVVLYEMLAGRRPFDGPDEHALRDAILFATPASLAAARPDVPSALVRLINDALAKHPNDRPASAAAFAAALEALAVDPVVSGLLTGAAGAAPSGRDSDRPEGAASDTAQMLPGGERRHATIVVGGLSGHARLVERCAPDDVDRVMRRLKHQAWQIVERHGGTVNEFGEERIVLLFGVPVSVEDHCVRAVRAALELRKFVREWRERDQTAAGLALYAAVDTGEAAVQRVDGALVPYRIAGQPVRLATQLCAHARADEILLSPGGARIVSPTFETMPASPVALPDDPVPCTPQRVVAEHAPQDRLDQMAAHARLAAFTGRGAELAMLVRAFDEARAGSGDLVTVTGEAGIGKSRLLLEFRRTLDAGSTTVLIGRCSSYGQATPYVPFLQALRQLLRLEPAVDRVPTDVEIAADITRIDPALELFVPHYLRLLSVPSETFRVPVSERDEQMRVVLQDGLIALLLAVAARQPLVLLLEDWHWADSASHEMVTRLADLLPAHRMLVVVTTRSMKKGDWTVREGHHTVSLRPLPAALTAAMICRLLDSDEVPNELAARLHERTGGNPFFLEEITRSLVEAAAIRVDDGRIVVAAGSQGLNTPATVQAVLRMRLDRLDLDARQTVRVAAVVGRDFAREILEQVLGDPPRVMRGLGTLVEAGIVQPTALVPEAAYTFRHALTQEAAYAGLLEHQRADLHGRVGEAIEQRYAGQLDEQLDRLAQHFSLAERWSKAVHYGLRSADRMRDLTQLLEALRMLDRIRDWTAMLGGTERQVMTIELLFRQERVCDTLGLRERQRQIVDELVATLESQDDAPRLVEACLRQGELRTVLGEFEPARESLDRSLRVSRERHDLMGERASWRALGFLRWSQGEYEESLSCGRAALRIDRQLNRTAAIVGELHNLAVVCLKLGSTAEARACLDEALALSQPAFGRKDPAYLHLWESRLAALYSYGMLLVEAGDLDGALTYLGADAEWSYDTNPLRIAYFSSAAARVLLLQGRLDEGLAAYRRAIEVTRRVHLLPQLAAALRLCGEVLLAIGRARDALGSFEEAAQTYARLKDRKSEALMGSHIARAHEQLGNTAEAHAGWERALVMHRQLDNAPGEIEALEGLGRVARRHLPAAVALRFYEDAITLATAVDDTKAVARLHNSAGILEWTRGRHDSALRHFEEALALMQTLGDDAGSGQMLNSIGVSLSALGRRDEARQCLEQAIAHHVRTGQTQLEGYALAALGDLEWEAGEIGSASTFYQQSLGRRREVGDVRGEGWMLLRLARAEASAGRAAEAEALRTRAAECSVRCSDEELMNACAEHR